MSGALLDLRIPDLGEGVEQGVVIAILVAAGSAVEAGQSVLEIETDKVTLEIPAPRAGVIREYCVDVDAVVRPGDVVLRMAGDDSVDPALAPAAPAAPAAASKATHSASSTAPEPAPVPPVANATRDALPARAAGAGVIPAGPAARREARQLGLDLSTLRGSGPRGRIVVSDVRNAVRAQLRSHDGGAASAVTAALPDLGTFGPVRREALSRRERATARNLSRAAQLIPHAWVEYRADVTALEAMRRQRRAAQHADAAPLTMSAILACCLGAALQAFPRFNAAIDSANDEVVYRDYVNLGIAVDTERGLLVPVLRDVAGRGVEEVAAELARLVRAARDNRLEPAELRGAGCTISNLGALGVSAMQPIVNWPEVAILGVSATQAAFVPHGDGFAVRQLLPLTLGFDHRLINGADAARFLSFIAERLADTTLLDGGERIAER